MKEQKSNEHSQLVPIENNRLDLLKQEKFLTIRVFHKISENVHYEIFKYLNYLDLLQIRAMKLGGFQLTSNRIMRSRIKNYFPKNSPKKINIQSVNINIVELIFEQTGEDNLDISSIGENQVRAWLPLLKSNLDIKGINLGNIYIYIYNCSK